MHALGLSRGAAGVDNAKIVGGRGLLENSGLSRRCRLKPCLVAAISLIVNIQDRNFELGGERSNFGKMFVVRNEHLGSCIKQDLAQVRKILAEIEAYVG